jgi:hypothetical protein
MMRVRPPYAVAPWRQWQDRSPSGPQIRNLPFLPNEAGMDSGSAKTKRYAGKRVSVTLRAFTRIRSTAPLPRAVTGLYYIE